MKADNIHHGDMFEMTVYPDGRRVSVRPGQTVLEGLVSGGVLLRSDCGGHGRCGKCTIRVDRPDRVTEPDASEVRLLGKDRLADGLRLACRAAVTGNLVIDIPKSSRLEAEVSRKGPAVFAERGMVAGFQPDHSCGLAVDLGTTTIAVYLCDLVGQSVVGSVSVRNPQALFGDDVMSRISAVTGQPDRLNRLQQMVVRSIDWAADALAGSFRVDISSLETLVVVGNPTMIHLLAGKDPSSIGVYPYLPTLDRWRWRAGDLGFRFNPAAAVRTLPLISGFLGADIVAAAMASDLSALPDGTMLVDVGTNGEIILRANGRFYAASAATGPAFEGAAIHHGMHAVSGAIDAVRIDPQDGHVRWSVIERNPNGAHRPAGLCGTGIISAAAALLHGGILSPDGRFNPGVSGRVIRENNGTPAFVLVPGEESDTGHPIVLTQKDIRAIQLAKGALRTGIDLLCREAGRQRPARLLLAGAFGSFIHPADALAIGMFPSPEAGPIQAVGNAAGTGAIMALFHPDLTGRAREMVKAIQVVDLASHPDFQDTFVSALAFPG